MSPNFQMINTLRAEAKQVYSQHFPAETWFERSIFFSWSCTLGDCAFCHMSTQEKQDTIKLRSNRSISAEALLCKQYGWKLGFLTGGFGAYPPAHLLEIVQKIYQATGQKCWISLGPLSRTQLETLKPYIAGVVGSIETINSELHKKICPSKPIRPYEIMFNHANELDIPTAMTFIAGMGETESDFTLLKEFISKHKMHKIWIYGVNAHEKTIFEGCEINKEAHAWWIAQVRIAFPTIQIQAGVWDDRADRVAYLLASGANGLSKFPATRAFGTTAAKTFSEEVAHAGRTFMSNLTQFQHVDWNKQLEPLPFTQEFKTKVHAKLLQYEEQMKSASQRPILLH